MMSGRLKRWIALVLIPSLVLNPLWAPAVRAYDASFGMEDLLKSGINGMFDQDCGGYCIVGACAHLVVKVSLSGIEIYTIVSPKIRHAAADLVVSAYSHVGEEPWREWQATFGNAMNAVNTGPVAALLGTPFGLQGGRPSRAKQDEHQSVSYKEVDIVGHPASLIPNLGQLNRSSRFICRGGPSNPNESSLCRWLTSRYRFSFLNNLGNLINGYRLPTIGSLPRAADAASIDGQNPQSGFNLSAMLNSGLTQIIDVVRNRIMAILRTFDILALAQRLMDLFTMLQDLLDFFNAAMTALEATTRSTIYANLVNPRFRAPRLFCPSQIMPFQPYYLSYTDSLFWRTGFPITDGPISGSNHSMTLLNPLSGDKLGSGLETWGHLYPRDGTVNSNHDAKAASVAAWRGMDVLLHDVRDGAGGHRMGVSLPPGYAGQRGLWQMIYPVKRECRATPYYPDDRPDLDFMQPNENGSYAWNYYHMYECCSNTKGRKILEVDLPPLCLNLNI